MNNTQTTFRRKVGLEFTVYRDERSLIQLPTTHTRLIRDDDAKKARLACDTQRLGRSRDQLELLDLDYRLWPIFVDHTVPIQEQHARHPSASI